MAFFKQKHVEAEKFVRSLYFLTMQLGMRSSPPGTEGLSGEGDAVVFAKLKLFLLSTFYFPPWWLFLESDSPYDLQV